MSSSQPDIKGFSLAEFFQSTYSVPVYQRNYTWGDTQIEEFLEDILEFNRSSEPYYLLGDVIVGKIKEGDYKFELVDGQQRATTLVCLFASIHAKATYHGLPLQDTNQIYNTFVTTKGGKVRSKVAMSGQASLIIEEYAQKSTELEISAEDQIQTKRFKSWHKTNAEILKNLTIDGAVETKSKANVLGALRRISIALDEEFGTNTNKLMKFQDRLLDDTYLGRITIDDVDKATLFFERVNDRGVRLNSADLLKNRVLQLLKDPNDYSSATELWEKADQRLYAAPGKGSMTYLTRLIRQAEMGVKIREQDVYKRIREKVVDETSCLEFTELIGLKFEPLARILEGRTPTGHEDESAVGSRFFGHIQNHGIKLAASHLDNVSFQILSRRLEGRAILSLYANEIPSRFENRVPAISQRILQLPKYAKESDIDKALDFAHADLEALFQVAYTKFDDLLYSGNKGMRDRIRYVLARCNAEVFPRETAGFSYDLAGYLTTFKTSKTGCIDGFDIDHVKAKALSDGAAENQQIGNLTLLYWLHNIVAGKKTVAEKQDAYDNSLCFLTRSLVSNPNIAAVFPKVDEYRVALVDDGSEWTVEKIKARQAMYFKIFFDAVAADLGFKRPERHLNVAEEVIDNIEYDD